MSDSVQYNTPPKSIGITVKNNIMGYSSARLASAKTQDSATSSFFVVKDAKYISVEDYVLIVSEIERLSLINRQLIVENEKLRQLIGKFNTEPSDMATKFENMVTENAKLQALIEDVTHENAELRDKFAKTVELCSKSVNTEPENYIVDQGTDGKNQSKNNQRKNSEDNYHHIVKSLNWDDKPAHLQNDNEHLNNLLLTIINIFDEGENIKKKIKDLKEKQHEINANEIIQITGENIDIAESDRYNEQLQKELAELQEKQAKFREEARLRLKEVKDLFIIKEEENDYSEDEIHQDSSIVLHLKEELSRNQKALNEAQQEIFTLRSKLDGYIRLDFTLQDITLQRDNLLIEVEEKEKEITKLKHRQLAGVKNKAHQKLEEKHLECEQLKEKLQNFENNAEEHFRAHLISEEDRAQLIERINEKDKEIQSSREQIVLLTVENQRLNTLISEQQNEINHLKAQAQMDSNNTENEINFLKNEIQRLESLIALEKQLRGTMHNSDQMLNLTKDFALTESKLISGENLGFNPNEKNDSVNAQESNQVNKECADKNENELLNQIAKLKKENTKLRNIIVHIKEEVNRLRSQDNTPKNFSFQPILPKVPEENNTDFHGEIINSQSNIKQFENPVPSNPLIQDRNKISIDESTQNKNPVRFSDYYMGVGDPKIPTTNIHGLQSNITYQSNYKPNENNQDVFPIPSIYQDNPMDYNPILQNSNRNSQVHIYSSKNLEYPLNLGTFNLRSSATAAPNYLSNPNTKILENYPSHVPSHAENKKSAVLDIHTHDLSNPTSTHHPFMFSTNIPDFQFTPIQYSTLPLMNPPYSDVSNNVQGNTNQKPQSESKPDIKSINKDVISNELQGTNSIPIPENKNQSIYSSHYNPFPENTNYTYTPLNLPTYQNQNIIPPFEPRKSHIASQIEILVVDEFQNEEKPSIANFVEPPKITTSSGLIIDNLAKDKTNIPYYSGQIHQQPIELSSKPPYQEYIYSGIHITEKKNETRVQNESLSSNNFLLYPSYLNYDGSKFSELKKSNNPIEHDISQPKIIIDTIPNQQRESNINLMYSGTNPADFDPEKRLITFSGNDQDLMTYNIQTTSIPDNKNDNIPKINVLLETNPSQNLLEYQKDQTNHGNYSQVLHSSRHENKDDNTKFIPYIYEPKQYQYDQDYVPLKKSVNFPQSITVVPPEQKSESNISHLAKSYVEPDIRHSNVNQETVPLKKSANPPQSNTNITSGHKDENEAPHLIKSYMNQDLQYSNIGGITQNNQSNLQGPPEIISNNLIAFPVFETQISQATQEFNLPPLRNYDDFSGFMPKPYPNGADFLSSLPKQAKSNNDLYIPLDVDSKSKFTQYGYQLQNDPSWLASTNVSSKDDPSLKKSNIDLKNIFSNTQIPSNYPYQTDQDRSYVRTPDVLNTSTPFHIPSYHSQEKFSNNSQISKTPQSYRVNPFEPIDYRNQQFIPQDKIYINKIQGPIYKTSELPSLNLTDQKKDDSASSMFHTPNANEKNTMPIFNSGPAQRFLSFSRPIINNPIQNTGYDYSQNNFINFSSNQSGLVPNTATKTFDTNFPTNNLANLQKPQDSIANNQKENYDNNEQKNLYNQSNIHNDHGVLYQSQPGNIGLHNYNDQQNLGDIEFTKISDKYRNKSVLPSIDNTNIILIDMINEPQTNNEPQINKENKKSAVFMDNSPNLNVGSQINPSEKLSNLNTDKNKDLDKNNEIQIKLLMRGNEKLLSLITAKDQEIQQLKNQASLGGESMGNTPIQGANDKENLNMLISTKDLELQELKNAHQDFNEYLTQIHSIIEHLQNSAEMIQKLAGVVEEKNQENKVLMNELELLKRENNKDTSNEPAEKIHNLEGEKTPADQNFLGKIYEDRYLKPTENNKLLEEVSKNQKAINEIRFLFESMENYSDLQQLEKKVLEQNKANIKLSEALTNRNTDLEAIKLKLVNLNELEKLLMKLSADRDYMNNLLKEKIEEIDHLDTKGDRIIEIKNRLLSLIHENNNLLSIVNEKIEQKDDLDNKYSTLEKLYFAVKEATDELDNVKTQYIEALRAAEKEEPKLKISLGGKIKNALNNFFQGNPNK